MPSDRFKNILREIMLIHPTFHAVLKRYSRAMVNGN